MMRRYKLGLRGREFVIDVQELGDDRFQVAVGEESFEVTLSGDEFLPEATITPGYQPAAGQGATHAPPQAASVMTARGPTTGTTVTSQRIAKPGGGAGASLNAPMPGLILELHVKVGDVVQRGQPVAVLDAMKMHNLIGAPRAGTIGEVCVAPGQAVGHGEPIVRYAEG